MSEDRNKDLLMEETEKIIEPKKNTVGTSEKKTKKTGHISTKLIVFFVVLVVVVLVINSVGIYLSRSNAYKEQNIQSMKKVGFHLRDELAKEGDTFIQFQDYMLENSLNVYIPCDFDEAFVVSAKESFERAFSERYPGKAFGKDVSFSDMDEELKLAFCTYYQAKWFLEFEEIAEDFDLSYVYFMYPNGNGSHVIYMFDVERVYEGDESENRLHLFDDYEESYEDCSRLFDTWRTGKLLDDYDIFDNEYGRTYSYYIPVYINAEKRGLIGVDLDIDYVNGNLIGEAVALSLVSGLILAFGLFICVFFIHRTIVSRIVRLSQNVGVYKRMKDGAVADDISDLNSGNDEIAVLYEQTASMIQEINEYMSSLKNTTIALTAAREEATHDSLTGIRNKNAYDAEVLSIRSDIEKGSHDYGIVMIDMNYLKRINDNYGHDVGNLAIRKLCRMICLTFEHSPVFRVGGDEFVVLLKGYDYVHIEQLAGKFNEEIDRVAGDNDLKSWERISAALGYALYDPDRDRSIEDTFARADKAMYNKKKSMKASRK